MFMRGHIAVIRAVTFQQVNSGATCSIYLRVLHINFRDAIMSNITGLFSDN